MATESRIKKSILNAKVNLLCYLVSIIIAFFTRRVFISTLGLEFIGLTGTISSLLSFLNIAELGVATAIGYVLYKPLYDKNREEINQIVSVLGYLYRNIGIFIFIAGILLSLFLPLYFSNVSINLGIIYLGFYSYLAASLLSYFVNYKMNLLAADQKNYVITGYFQVITSVKVIIQMLFAIYICSFALYLIFELLFSIINAIVLNIKIKQTYPWLESSISNGRDLLKKYPEISKYIKQLFIHKIAGFVQFQVTPLIIYSVVSLPVVALYGNYVLLTDRFKSLNAGLFAGIDAGIGNLVAENNAGLIKKAFLELFSIRFFISFFVSSCIFLFSSSFIEVWLGGEYKLSTAVVALLSIHLFMTMFRSTVDQFLQAYGLFYDVWAPAAEAIIFIFCSIVLGRLYGLPGVLSGPVFSNLIIVYIWKPIFLFSKGFHVPFYEYYKLLLWHLICGLIALGCSVLILQYFNIESCGTWTSWIVNTSLFSVIFFCLFFVVLYYMTYGFKSFLFRFIKKKNKKNE